MFFVQCKTFIAKVNVPYAYIVHAHCMYNNTHLLELVCTVCMYVCTFIESHNMCIGMYRLMESSARMQLSFLIKRKM